MNNAPERKRRPGTGGASQNPKNNNRQYRGQRPVKQGRRPEPALIRIAMRLLSPKVSQ
jgi:hypothetical protein